MGNSVRDLVDAGGLKGSDGGGGGGADKERGNSEGFKGHETRVTGVAIPIE